MPAHKLFTCSLVIATLLATPDLASADVSRYEEPIRYRKAAMTMIKRHYTQINAMATGKIPVNQGDLIRHASYLEMLSRAALDGFVPGSHEGDTRAKPEIWTEWARYRSLNDQFTSDATRLRDAAKSNNVATLKTAVNDMTRTCKNCHDDFRTLLAGQ